MKDLKERTPPHSREAEESVLGSLMMSQAIVPDAITRISDPSIFYIDIHRAIFLAM